MCVLAGRGLNRASRVLPREIGPPQKSDLGVEAASDVQMLELRAIAVGVVVEVAQVAGVVAPDLRRAGPGDIPIEVHAARRGVQGIDPERLARSPVALRLVAPRVEHADVAPPEDVALDSHHGEIRGPRVCRHLLIRLDIEHPDRIGPRLAGDPSPAPDWYRTSVVEPDAAAEEQHRRIVGDAYPTAAGRNPNPAESENALTFKKEVPALGEEEVEPRQVDLLEVVFDLREIGVVGQVERQALREAVLHVEADIAVGVVDK